MTDRELLEAAAKAADLWPSPEPFEHILSRWNPLADDGDALRLAVDLGLAIEVWFGAPKYTDGVSVITTPENNIYSESHGADKRAATRRAIVRAAAALAKP